MKYDEETATSRYLQRKEAGTLPTHDTRYRSLEVYLQYRRRETKTLQKKVTNVSYKELRTKNTKQWRLKNSEHMRKLRRNNYWKDVGVSREQKRNWANVNHEKVLSLRKKYYYQNPKKAHARVRDRELGKRNIFCESCGIDESLHLHHSSYEQHVVTTLCRRCHALEHRLMNNESEQSVLDDYCLHINTVRR